jgi:hypothetical protein
LKAIFTLGLAGVLAATLSGCVTEGTAYDWEWDQNGNVYLAGTRPVYSIRTQQVVQAVTQGVGDFARGYAQSHERSQSSWDEFDIQQKLEQIQREEQNQFQQQQNQRAFDRLRDGLAP